MNIKKLVSVSAAAIVFAVMFLPLPLPGTAGIYNTASGLIWCTSEVSCIHEVGHKLDDEGGWISHSEEFQRDVALVLGHPVPPGFLNKDIREMYADLFAMARGKEENMPPLLRPYYDWERADELIKKIRGKK